MEIPEIKEDECFVIMCGNTDSLCIAIVKKSRGDTYYSAYKPYNTAGSLLELIEFKKSLYQNWHDYWTGHGFTLPPAKYNLNFYYQNNKELKP